MEALRKRLGRAPIVVAVNARSAVCAVAFGVEESRFTGLVESCATATPICIGALFLHSDGEVLRFEASVLDKRICGGVVRFVKHLGGKNMLRCCM